MKFTEHDDCDKINVEGCDWERSWNILKVLSHQMRKEKCPTQDNRDWDGGAPNTSQALYR